MNTSLFKEICSTYATGVTIITSKDNNIDYGFTANSFTSVSIDPLLVLFCLNKEAKSNIALKKNSFFNVSILSNLQKDICYQFANNKLSQKERFKGVETTESKNNIKIISNSCSFLECKITCYSSNSLLFNISFLRTVLHEIFLLFQLFFLCIF